MKRNREPSAAVFFDSAEDGGYFSSPALKIRRLDAEMLQQAGQEPETCDPPAVEESTAAEEEENNEERAIVLYKPAEAANTLLLGPLRPTMPLRPEPYWIYGLGGRMFDRPRDFTPVVELPDDDDRTLAMVPWVADRNAVASTAEEPRTEEMEADEGEPMMMELEEETNQQLPSSGSAAIYQWPLLPQPCVPPSPALPMNPPPVQPVTWSG